MLNGLTFPTAAALLLVCCSIAGGGSRGVASAGACAIKASYQVLSDAVAHANDMASRRWTKSALLPDMCSQVYCSNCWIECAEAAWVLSCRSSTLSCAPHDRTV